jgi:hypothetical protein
MEKHQIPQHLHALRARQMPCNSWLLLIARSESEAALRKGVYMEGRHDRALDQAAANI